jgi:hypothetical protein
LTGVATCPKTTGILAQVSADIEYMVDSMIRQKANQPLHFWWNSVVRVLAPEGELPP